MAEPTEYYAIRFSADPMQLIFFRHGLDRWLAGLGWPEPDRIDAVLAISEACGNAVERAYPAPEPGDVEVTGRVVLGRTDRRLMVVVRDHGRWRTSGGDGGYGIATLRACMDRVRIRHDTSGTVVTMTSRSVPLVATPVPPQQRSAEDLVPHVLNPVFDVRPDLDAPAPRRLRIL
ncbi:MAG: ATP-binding protein [Pseudonocardia sp.]|nr:ATP-binding protein [Pseudonocardia sp.]